MPDDPFIQKPQLLVGMKPMLAAGQDGQLGMVLLGKCRYRFYGCQVIVFAVQNFSVRREKDRLLPHGFSWCHG